MQKYAKERIDTLFNEELCGFIFKSKSPSCGLGRGSLFTLIMEVKRLGMGLDCLQQNLLKSFL